MIFIKFNKSSKLHLFTFLKPCEIHFQASPTKVNQNFFFFVFN